MHWTITNKHSRWRKPMQTYCHQADPSLPVTCQLRASQWLSETRTMERMISGGSRFGCRGLWRSHRHLLENVLNPGLPVPPEIRMPVDYQEVISTATGRPLYYSMQKLLISVNLDNQITYTKFSSQRKGTTIRTSLMSWEKSAGMEKGRWH